MTRRLYRVLRVALLLSLILPGLSGTIVRAATVTVTSASDSGSGSFREAINTVNAGNADTIIFNINGAATIVLASSLPAISRTVTIDATTQPGYGGSPIVELRGSNVPVNGLGLQIGGNGSVVKGLAINGFSAAGIYITSSSNTIQSSFIGTNTAGSAAIANVVGINVSGGSNNIIGGTAAGTRNVISGNSNSGILVASGTTGTMIQGNLIGTDLFGAVAIANPVGIYIAGSSNNTIGGTAAGARNVIAGNAIAGMTIDGSAGSTTNNVIQGNFIGTNAAGSAALPNNGGIALTNTSGNTVGGTAGGARNIISGNIQNGLTIDGTASGASNNTVQGNYVGTDVNGTTPIPNNVGVALFKASNNTIGGTTAAQRNILSGNANGNLTIIGTGGTATGNVIEGNFIGTDPTGATPVGHCDAGVYILDASGNTVGGTTAGAGNIISGNNKKGINSTGLALDGSNNSTSFNLIQGNVIGTDITGTVSIPNGVGIYIAAGDNNTIGGTAPGARNIISGNTPGNGVSIDGHRASDGAPKAASGNVIQGNFIGTNAAGTAALPNGVGASITSGSGNTVAYNIISGNTSNGIAINVLDGVTPAANNLIQQNFIGTNAAGTAAVPNNIGAAITNASNNTIVGNVISGNTNTGVFLNVLSASNTAANNTIQGNFIGTNAAGTAAIANGQQGVSLASVSNNLIGGATASARNIISGNRGSGIFIQGNNVAGVDASANRIQGNFIGTDAAGTGALGNGVRGIYIQGGNNNSIGGDLYANAGFSNTIANNGEFGVVVSGASGDSILGNSITANASGGISLGSGTGNHNQAAPVINTVAYNGNQLTVSGTLNSTANTTFRVEFFANPASSSNQGKTFLAATSVATNGGGAGTFNGVVIPFVPAGQFVTATATNTTTNDTSAFSNAKIVPPAPPPTITSVTPNGGPTSGGTSVTIIGTNFFAGATVRFGGAASPSVNVVSSTKIIASAPAHAAGTVDVVVINADNQSATDRNAYTYVDPLPNGRPGGQIPGANPAPEPPGGSRPGGQIPGANPSTAPPRR